MIDVPHRAVTLEVKIEADSRQSMIDALDSIGQQIARGELTTGVTGGYDSGWVYSYKESASPTHDEYSDMLSEYLKKKQDDAIEQGVIGRET